MKSQSPKEIEKERVRQELLKLVKPGDTVYTVLNHVSRSGIQREISLYLMIDNAPVYISGWAGILLDLRRGKRDGLIIIGGGMGFHVVRDMGFHVVSNLSCHLFPDGFGCIGEQCPSNDHSNGDRDHTEHDKADDGRTCDTCKGTGIRSFIHFKSFIPFRGQDHKKEPCGWCAETGKRNAGHWHKSGDYALRHRWI